MAGSALQRLPYIGLGLSSLAFVGMLFFGTALAAGFAGLSGGSGSGSTTGGGGTLAGDCDYDKILSAASLGQAEGESVAANAPQTVPSKFIPIYTKVSESKKLGGCGPSIMAATHAIESGFADTGYSTVNSAGAGGPWQFLSGSWDAFGAECNEGGSRSWPAYSVENGACAAANHWISGGAPKDWHAGIYSYNHAEWYVYAVATLAEKFAKQTGGGSGSEGGSGNGNAEKNGDAKQSGSGNGTSEKRNQ